ncbi:MAG TPA: mechanosensitive ion channel domain-containing protein [Candidatus Methanomethylophilaceae archaeon]|nr:mechanosensitive ion channel domain-containing protein [Candidatus Methanomethylophilaceae archaeon]
MKRKITIMTLFVVIVALLAAPMLVPEAQAAPNMGEMEFLFEGLPVDSNVNPIRLNAGEEVEVRVFITNTSPVNWTVTLNARDSPNITYVGEPVTLFVEAAGGEKSVREHDMKFSTDKFTREGAGDSEITLHIMDGGPGYTVTDLIHFDISSNLSAAGNFNKIMGVVPNVLPEPFDSPTASAIFTLAIWFLIAILIVKAIIPAIMFLPMRGRRKVNKTEEVKSAYKMVFIVVIIYGLYETLKVLGASEYIIDFSGRVAGVLYVLLGALITWEIYTVAVEHIFSRRGPDGGPGAVDQTLIPLFNMIGKIIIGTIAIAVAFSVLGADLVGIVAGAGIAGLALSLGAQSMLRQFFSGITLLTTRPFKEGDLVIIGDSIELKVQKVGIMTTWFKTPWNEVVISIPNDKVASSNISNMTGENLFYRFNLFLEVSRDADITLAKKLLEDAAMEHPEVIKDGTVFMPFARAMDVTESGIKIRLAAFAYNYEDSWGVEAALRERALKDFKANGIRMAYNRIDIRTDPTSKVDYDL